MKEIFFLLLFLIGFQHAIFSQTNSGCPRFTVEEPHNAGNRLSFKVIFHDSFDSSNLKFNWIVSTGRIVNGQGTSSLVVEPQGTEATATVELKGLPSNCNNVYTGSFVWERPSIKLLDGYSKISPKNELQKLNNLTKSLQDDPTAQAVIVKTFPLNFSRARIDENLKQILNLLKSLHIDESRYSFGINYEIQKKTTFYIVPAGAVIPTVKEFFTVGELEAKLKTIR